MCTWCIHSWAHLKYQDWFGTHSNMHHTYILCTSKQKSHISLKERWSETKVRRTLLHIWSTILSQYFFTLSLFKSKQNHGVLFKLLNFWSLCLCLDKKIMLPIFEPITLAFFTLPLFGPIFDHLSKSLIMLPFLGQFFYHFVLLLEPVTLPCTIREIYIRQSLRASLKLCMYCHIQLHTADHSLTTQQ